MANKRINTRRRPRQRRTRRRTTRGSSRRVNDSIKIYASRNFTISPTYKIGSSRNSLAAASGWLITLAWWMSIAARLVYVAATWVNTTTGKVRKVLTPIGLLKIMPISAADLIIDTPYCFDLAETKPKNKSGKEVPVLPGRNNLTGWTNFSQARILSLTASIRFTGDKTKATGEYAIALCEPLQPEDPHTGPYHEHRAWKDLMFDDITKRRCSVRALAGQNRSVTWRPSVVSGSIGLQPLKMQLDDAVPTDTYNYGHRVVVLFGYQTTAFSNAPSAESFDAAIDNFSLTLKAVIELSQPGEKRQISGYFYGQNWAPNVTVKEYGKTFEISTDSLRVEDDMVVIDPNLLVPQSDDFEMVSYR